MEVNLQPCLRAADPRIVDLVERLAAVDAPPGDRPVLLAELLALADAELACAHERWTPHYDHALRAITSAKERLLDEHTYGGAGGEWAFANDHIARVRDGFARHARIVKPLRDAARRGARTLADAFDLCSISMREIGDWFELTPDPDGLLRWLCAGCERYLAEHAATPDERARIEKVRVLCEGGGTANASGRSS